MLYERTILDVRAAGQVSDKGDFADFMLVSLSDALSPNLKDVKVWKRRKLKALIAPRSLQEALTPSQVYNAWIELQVLEGAEKVECPNCKYVNLDRFPECVKCGEAFKKKAENQ